MPGFLFHAGAGVQCFHAAPATVAATQPRVQVGGLAVATVATTNVAVTGCPFQVPVPGGTKPQPCVRIIWGTTSAKVSVAGSPVLLGPLPGVVAGVCQSVEQIPQGAPTLSRVQTKVSAT